MKKRRHGNPEPEKPPVKLDLSSFARTRGTILRLAKCIFKKDPKLTASEVGQRVRDECVKWRIPYDGAFVDDCAKKVVYADQYKRPKPGYGFN